MQAGSTDTNTVLDRDDGRVHLPYLPGLDGLRALAVFAVLFYHADLNVYGGYLGVESFFVLSGFLITALLYLDWQRNGSIQVRAFWARRARRLLPALILTLAGALALTVALLPDERAAVAGDTLAALAYVTNWYLIAGQQSYFDAAERASLLQHLWSLAVEEQFYLVWPLVFAAGMRWLRLPGLLALLLVTAAASTGLMAVLYTPGTDPSRIYYGTDTRITGLLLGAALALVWTPASPRWAASPKAGVVLDTIAVLALAALISAYMLLYEQHPLLYRGGFSLVAVATAIVIAATTHPATRFTPWLLERAPLRWIGLRSYGIYLWHWPIFMVTRPGVDVPYDGWPLQILRFAAALALAALSYTFVEMPIRRGVLGRVWRALRDTQGGGASHRWLSAGRWKSYREREPWIASSAVLLAVLFVGASIAQALVMPHSSIGLATIGAHQREITAPEAAPSTARTALSRETAATNVPLADRDDMTPVQRADPTETIDPTLAMELQHLLNTTVADGTIPGAVLTVQLSDGTTWTGASGVANRESAETMQVNTRVRIGSLTKMFVAVVVLQLVEEGVIDLDDTVASWLPELVPNGDIITVRQLLQHTSGLYDYLEDRRFVMQAYQDPEHVWRPAELVAYATSFPPSFNPGAPDSWDYSSTNYVVLGMIVEEVTGNTLAQELRQRIFEPLSLHQTYVVPDDQIEGPQAHGYSKGDDQTDVAMSFTFAAANIVTTVDDLRTFGRALFRGQLLEPTTQTLMTQFVDGQSQYNMPELEYGLGLMATRLPLGLESQRQEASRVVGHIGGFGGFRAALWYMPETNMLIGLGVNQASTDPNELLTTVQKTCSPCGPETSTCRS